MILSGEEHLREHSLRVGRLLRHSRFYQLMAKSAFAGRNRLQEGIGGRFSAF